MVTSWRWSSSFQDFDVVVPANLVSRIFILNDFSKTSNIYSSMATVYVELRILLIVEAFVQR